MKKIAVIGGGISGLSIAQMLKDKHQVRVFEKDSKPGGLIKCDRIKGNLYHKVGGHVFNSKNQDVLNWFWKFFNKEEEFIKTPRNATVFMSGGHLVGYPIENHAYMMDEAMMKSFIYDLLVIAKSTHTEPENFEEFLIGRFGRTLYKEYFQPYNEKIWRKDLKKVPLTWLEGKLPMPSVEEMIYNNFNHVKEMNMVHSSFFYPKQNGSQFLADRLASGLDIIYNAEVTRLEKKMGKWIINEFEYDTVIYCGNIKTFPEIIAGQMDMSFFTKQIENLEYHGTTSVLCEIDKNPYSWIYMPGREHLSHRIICTGNFSKLNNAENMMTGTLEFTDYISEQEILGNLEKIPFSPKYLAHQYTKFTYPIQDMDTRSMINKLKEMTEANGVYLLGRFAEWEYYNMDAAIDAAMKLYKNRFEI